MNDPREKNFFSATLHDRYTLEGKIIFPLDPKASKEKFSLRYHLKLATGLKITPNNFGPDDFDKSIVQYLRYQTPEWTLQELLDPENSLSALARLEKSLPAESKKLRSTTLRELRMLGSQLKQIFQHNQNSQPLIQETQKLLDRLERIHLGYQEKLLQKEFSRHLLPVLGYCHLLALENLSQSTQGEKEKQLILERLKDRYPRFNPFRHQHNDNLPNWESKIKRFVQKVFFLPMHRESGKKTTLEMISVIAAGVAMMISLGLVYWISGYFEGQGFGLATGLVVAYIIKDRVKDAVKKLGSRLAGRFLPDDQYRIQDPKAGVRMGTVKDFRAYIQELPREALEAAILGYMDPLEEGILSPKWISMNREITFLSRKINQIHQREEALESVLRINFQPLLTHATYSKRERVFWNGQENAPWKGDKSYTAYLVLERGFQDHWEQQIFRLQLTRKGIQSIKSLT